MNRRISQAYYQSPLGAIVVEVDSGAVVSLRYVEDDVAAAATDTITQSHNNAITDTFRWLDVYFSGREPSFMPPIRLRGTAFQQKVWRELMAVPYGRTVSYGELGRRVGCRSAQAVGGAVGRNPVAVIVPCHRVVGADGSLTGYAYGLDRKRRLLQLEGILSSNQYSY